MARAGDAEGTRGGRASLQSCVQGHTNTRGGRSPFTQPSASIRVPLCLVPGSHWRCHPHGVALGKPVCGPCCAMGHTEPCQQLCPPACAQAWLWSDMGGTVVVPPCDCAHPHMRLWSLTGVAVLVPLRGSHTRVSVFIHVCSHPHAHTEPWLYTCVAMLTHTRGHVHAHASLFSYS